VVIGVLLAVVGFNFLLESINVLKNHKSVNYGTFAVVVTIISVVLKESLAQYAFYTARKTGAKSLKADGWHHRTDAISSLIILAGIWVGSLYWWIDGVLGLAVALLIFYSSYEILKETISNLLGEKPDYEFAEQIRKIANSCYNQDIQPHHILMHEYGQHKQISLHIKLPPDMNMTDAHEIATKVEKKLLESLNLHTTVHMEPKTSNSCPPLLPDPIKPK